MIINGPSSPPLLVCPHCQHAFAPPRRGVIPTVVRNTSLVIPTINVTLGTTTISLAHLMTLRRWLLLGSLDSLLVPGYYRMADLIAGFAQHSSSPLAPLRNQLRPSLEVLGVPHDAFGRCAGIRRVYYDQTQLLPFDELAATLRTTAEHVAQAHRLVDHDAPRPDPSHYPYPMRSRSSHQYDTSHAARQGVTSAVSHPEDQ